MRQRWLLVTHIDTFTINLQTPMIFTKVQTARNELTVTIITQSNVHHNDPFSDAVVNIRHGPLPTIIAYEPAMVYRGSTCE